MSNTIRLEGKAAEVFYEKISKPLSATQKRSVQRSAGTYEAYRAKWIAKKK